MLAQQIPAGNINGRFGNRMPGQRLIHAFVDTRGVGGVLTYHTGRQQRQAGGNSFREGRHIIGATRADFAVAFQPRIRGQHYHGAGKHLMRSPTGKSIRLARVR